MHAYSGNVSNRDKPPGVDVMQTGKGTSSSFCGLNQEWPNVPVGSERPRSKENTEQWTEENLQSVTWLTFQAFQAGIQTLTILESESTTLSCNKESDEAGNTGDDLQTAPCSFWFTISPGSASSQRLIKKNRIIENHKIEN